VIDVDRVKSVLLDHGKRKEKLNVFEGVRVHVVELSQVIDVIEDLVEGLANELVRRS
jgi:hypothetical protein